MDGLLRAPVHHVAAPLSGGRPVFDCDHVLHNTVSGSSVGNVALKRNQVRLIITIKTFFVLKSLRRP